MLPEYGGSPQGFTDQLTIPEKKFLFSIACAYSRKLSIQYLPIRRCLQKWSLLQKAFSIKTLFQQ